MNVRSSFTATVFYRCATATLVFLLGLPVSNAATESQENTPQPTSASVYANAIGDARFERSAIHVEQGYTIESGNLYPRDGETGSLVVVRSPDGTVTSIVDEPGKRGILVVDTKGKSTFVEEPAYDYLTPDTIEADGPEPVANAEDIKAGGTWYIDTLVAYSASALARLNADPVAYALAQMETANLGLRNSRVTGLSLRLAAVNVFDVPYDNSEAGLGSWQTLLEAYRRLYSSDINAAISTASSNIAGMAYRSGYTSANGWNYPTAFRHEVGHNAGGDALQ